MKAVDTIAKTLLIVGGLNWGLVGLFQYDLVAGIFGGQDAALSRVVYTVVGLSAAYLAVRWATKPSELSASRPARAH